MKPLRIVLSLKQLLDLIRGSDVIGLIFKFTAPATLEAFPISYNTVNSFVPGNSKQIGIGTNLPIREIQYYDDDLIPKILSSTVSPNATFTTNAEIEYHNYNYKRRVSGRSDSPPNSVNLDQYINLGQKIDTFDLCLFFKSEMEHIADISLNDTIDLIVDPIFFRDASETDSNDIEYHLFRTNTIRLEYSLEIELPSNDNDEQERELESTDTELIGVPTFAHGIPCPRKWLDTNNISEVRCPVNPSCIISEVNSLIRIGQIPVDHSELLVKKFFSFLMTL